MMKPCILLVDDSDRFLGSLQTALAADYDTRLAKSLEEARKALHLRWMPYCSTSGWTNVCRTVWTG